MFMFAPLLYGAGIGALGGLLTGNDPLKTALLGAAIGTGAGALGVGGTAAAGAKAGLATGTGTAIKGTGIALGDIAGSKALADTALAGSNLASGIGVGTGVGGSAGTGIQLASGGGGLMAFNPVSAAQGAAGISNLGQYATGTGTDIMAASPTLYDKLKPYATIDNLAGANMIANQFKPTPRSPAPQGRITQGQAPQGGSIGGGGVEGLLAEIMKRQQQQYQPISLL